VTPGPSGQPAPGRLATILARVLDRVERAGPLDVAVGPVRTLGERAVGTGSLRDLLSGTELGHPAHPMLVDLPIGFWTSAMALDFTGTGQRPAARRLVGLGVLSALPAVAAGVSDWTDTDGAEARVGLVHATSNLTALACYSVSWWKRRQGGNAGQVWALAGATAATLGGWLGGHLAYSLGVGVDTNAFGTGPTQWAPVVGELAGDRSLGRVVADGVPIVVVRTGWGVHALADRCSHRGGPLSEGHRDGECITCPWHGSQFDLASGIAARGPATARQPVYETRVTDQGLEVRRDEPRALRRRSARSGPAT
jgi:nitrite reductase/ring-hydroxylating ferredoxin subunit/uncharacterized membrane protein